MANTVIAQGITIEGELTSDEDVVIQGTLRGKLVSKDTVAVDIDVSPYKSGQFQVGFARGFVASQAYANHFGSNTKVRPNKKDLIFDIKTKSGSVKFGSKARRTRAAINARGLPTSLFNKRLGGAGPSTPRSDGGGPDRTRGAERVEIRGVPNGTSLVGLGTRCVVALLGKSHSPRLQEY